MKKCPRCKQPMKYRYVNPPRKYVCMVCAVKRAQRTMARLRRNELVPVQGWAWRTEDGWHASQAAPKPAVVRFIACKIMVPRKYVGMDGRIR